MTGAPSSTPEQPDLIFEGVPVAPPVIHTPNTRGILLVLIGILIALVGLLYFVSGQALLNPIQLKQDHCVESGGQPVWSTAGSLVCDVRPYQSPGQSFGQTDWVIIDGASANPYGE